MLIGFVNAVGPIVLRCVAVDKAPPEPSQVESQVAPQMKELN